MKRVRFSNGLECYSPHQPSCLSKGEGRAMVAFWVFVSGMALLGRLIGGAQ